MKACILLLAFCLLTTFKDASAVYCSGEGWFLSSRNCWKLIKSPVSMATGLALCNSQPFLEDDVGVPHLLEITTQEEQISVEAILQEDPASPSIWLGGVRLPGNESTFFHWQSSSEFLQYSNWDVNRPTSNPDRGCIELQTAASRTSDNFTTDSRSTDLGRWEDVTCEKGNWVICQKMPSMTPSDVVVALRTLDDEGDNLAQQVVNISSSCQAEHDLIWSAVWDLGKAQYNLRMDLSELNTSHQLLSVGHDELKKTVTESAEDLKELDSKVGSIQVDLDDLTRSQSKLEERLVAHETSSSLALASLRKDLDALVISTGQQLTHLTNTLATLSGQVSSLQSSLISLEARHNALDILAREGLTNLRSELESLTASTQTKFDGLNSLVVTLTGKVDGIVNADGLFRLEFNLFKASTTTTLGELVTDLDILGNNVVSLQIASSAHDGHLSAYRVRIEVAEKDVRDLKSDLATVTGTATQLNQRTTKLEGEVLGLNSQLDSVSDAIVTHSGQYFVLENRVQQLELKIIKIGQDWGLIESGVVPKGYVYMQLPGMPTPATIWPQFGWNDVSSRFSGDFLRVLGGNSAPFGTEQAENFRTLKTRYAYSGDTHESGTIPKSGPSLKLQTALVSKNVRYWDGMIYEWTQEENRPVNVAMKVWERL